MGSGGSGRNRSLASRARRLTLRQRVPLGKTGIEVSPVCVGIVGDPAIVAAAYDAGINFFFVSADMHWPAYEPLRLGLRQLLRRSRGTRRRLVVAVASYLTQPEFSRLPFTDVLSAIPELEYIDMAVIGGTYRSDFAERLACYRAQRPGGMRALGASFHDRRLALRAIERHEVDAAFVRYNAAHPAAEPELFDKLRGKRTTRVWTFQSTHAFVAHHRLDALGLPPRNWRPHITDHYRFALRIPQIDGLLCSFQQPEHVSELRACLRRGPLTAEQATYLKRLSALDAGQLQLIGE